MVQMDVITSLKIVKEELDSNIAKASSALEQFAANTQAVHHLGECQDLLKQASSVLKLLNFDGATHLLNEMIALIARLQQDGYGAESDVFMEQMACLGLSLIQLEHFLEYTLLKEQHMPVLLVERINAIRRLLKQSPILDSTFVHTNFKSPSILDMYQVFGEDMENPSFRLDNVGPYCKPFRLMFQVGLVSILREKKVLPGSVNIMSRSLERICGICGAVPITKLWFLARGVLLAFQAGNVSVTPSRLFVLSKIERQMKQMVYGRDEFLQLEPPESLVRECLAIIAVGAPNEGATEKNTLLTAIQDLFEARATISDVVVQEQTKLMNGPTGAVIQSVVQLIYEELAPLREAMDLRARQTLPDWTLEKTPLEVVEQTAHTLNMVGELGSAAILKEQSLIIQQLTDPEANPTLEELQSLADTFVFIEQSLSRLLSHYAVNLDDEDETILSPRSVLEQARHMIFVESRSSLGVVKRSISSYVDSHGDGTYLEQVSAQLQSSLGALRFLHLDRAAKVLASAHQYISQFMIDQDHMPAAEVLETLADVLTSVDYYLESLEDNKAIGEGVLEAAEISVNMLKQAFEQSVSRVKNNAL